MSLFIATYNLGGAQDSEEYDSLTPYDVDIELPIILKRKYGWREMPDDFEIVSVYDVEMDDLIEFPGAD